MPEQARPPPEKCLPTKWHSKQKHAFIEAYLRIWTDHVGRKNPKKALSLDIVDMNAGTGWCFDSTLDKPWEGTAVLAAQALRDYKTQHKRRLFLNSFNSGGGEAQEAQLAALQEAIAHERPNGEADFGLEIQSMPSTSAVDHFLKRVNRRFPNIWLLDPYKTEELPWEVVEKILTFTHEWTNPKGQTITRRPEVFLSLMTHAVQRNVEKDPNIMSNALGLPEHQWMPQFEELRKEGLNTREATLELYLGRLREYYDKEPVTLEIPGSHGNIVYILIFCTDHDAGYYMLQKEGLPAFNVWRDMKWVPAAEATKAIRKQTRAAEKVGQKFTRLSDFVVE